MKNDVAITFSFLAILIFLSSCSTTNDVVSNSSIVKRKYRKGYYVQRPQLFNKQSDISSALPKEEIIKSPTSSDEEIPLTASAENVLLITRDENTIDFKPASKLARTIKSVKHLYDSDITDFKLFRTEYKKIKTGFRSNFALSGKNSKAFQENYGGKYGVSIASLVCALVGFVIAGIILGSLAILLGILALANRKKGKVIAILGIVLGAVDVIGVLIILST